jgi:hypothetical protein
LEGLEQEAMDERMLNTGPVPVTSQLDRLPEAGKSERKSIPFTVEKLRIPLTVVQWLERPPQSRQRKTTRKPSLPSCAPKWPCSTPSSLISHMQFFSPRLASCLT